MPNIDMPYFVDSEGNQGYFKDVTAMEQISDIRSNDNVLHGSVLNLQGIHDKAIIIKETGNEDYKMIVIKDANDVERYSLRFSGGHLDFTSRDASGNIIVNNQRLA